MLEVGGLLSVVGSTGAVGAAAARVQEIFITNEFAHPVPSKENTMHLATQLRLALPISPGVGLAVTIVKVAEATGPEAHPERAKTHRGTRDRTHRPPSHKSPAPIARCRRCRPP